MSLTSAISIARSALATSQIGIQVSSNNIANAATPGYSRQIASLESIGGAAGDVHRIGRGVRVGSVDRQVNDAVQQRLWTGIADEHAAAEGSAVMSQLESILNELSGFDLSTELSSFFNAWSEATSLVDSGGAVVSQGGKLSSFMTSMREELSRLRDQMENQIDASVSRADTLLDEIAILNREISGSESGAAKANALRDQRDQLISELSQLADVTAIEDAQGNLDVLIGSTPIVLAGQSLGLGVERETDDGVFTLRVVTGRDGTPVPISAGAIGALVGVRDGTVDGTIEKLDELAARLIFEVNRLHSTGTNEPALTSTEGALQIPTADRTLALNDPNSELFANLPFSAVNGGFLVNITGTANPDNPVTTVHRIDVDLDGLDATGTPGFADDTTPEDIRAALDAIPGLTAGFDATGRLVVDAGAGFEFSFQDDTSGALAVIGVNSYFTGTGAADITVRSDLVDEPTRLSLGRIVDGSFVENGTAMEIVGLQSRTIADLGNATFEQSWYGQVLEIAGEAGTADTRAEASRLVRENLKGQRASISGVSMDEETINLLAFQRQFQGAARLIDIADQLFQQLLSLV